MNLHLNWFIYSLAPLKYTILKKKRNTFLLPVLCFGNEMFILDNNGKCLILTFFFYFLQLKCKAPYLRHINTIKLHGFQYIMWNLIFDWYILNIRKWLVIKMSSLFKMNKLDYFPKLIWYIKKSVSTEITNSMIMLNINLSRTNMLENVFTATGYVL